jgi:hypothetical protein
MRRGSGGDLWSDGRVCFMNPSERLPKPDPLRREGVGEEERRTGGRDEDETRKRDAACNHAT